MITKSYAGINIQYPISREILAGNKTVETRTYPLPESYIGKTLLLIETPGKSRTFKSRVIAKFKISRCFLYTSKKAFYRDSKRHLVTPDSLWAWKDKPKWGWEIDYVKPLKKQIEVTGIGIKYTKSIIIK